MELEIADTAGEVCCCLSGYMCYIIIRITLEFGSLFTLDLLEDRRMDYVINNLLFLS